MIYSLTWLPAVLESAGLKVARVDGWESRGHGDVGEICGVICHHTAGAATGNMPSLRLLIEGRSDLSGPLAQLGLGRDGTYYVIAAGRAYHAGKGAWSGISDGNSNFIGIEAENTGLPGDNWPDIQMDAYRHGVAAILKHIGRGPEFCAGHCDYALPKGRKTDPSFSTDTFRLSVAAIMNGEVPPLPLIPTEEPAGRGGTVARRTLRRGDSGELVQRLQRTLGGLTIDGNFGSGTEAAVRRFQTAHGLVPDGIVGPKTWATLDAVTQMVA